MFGWTSKKCETILGTRPMCPMAELTYLK